MKKHLLLRALLITPILVACSGALKAERDNTPSLNTVEAMLPAVEAAGVIGLQAAQVTHMANDDTLDALVEGPKYRTRYVLLYMPAAQPGLALDLFGPAAGSAGSQPEEDRPAVPEKDSFGPDRSAPPGYVYIGTLPVHRELLGLGLGQAAVCLVMLVFLVLYRFPK